MIDGFCDHIIICILNQLIWKAFFWFFTQRFSSSGPTIEHCRMPKYVVVIDLDFLESSCTYHCLWPLRYLSAQRRNSLENLRVSINLINVMWVIECYFEKILSMIIGDWIIFSSYCTYTNFINSDIFLVFSQKHITKNYTQLKPIYMKIKLNLL